jgi:prepilin-type N-terminal cleavage/methylation domain-containing protein
MTTSPTPRQLDSQSRTPAIPQRGARAFTLVELLLTISIIAIVLALIFVAIGRLQNQARATACLSNQRQIALANQTYAADNAGRFVSPRTDALPPTGGMTGTSNCWVNTGVSGALTLFASAPRNERRETSRALEAGALWSYLGENVVGYSSPMDPTGRLRSYSLSGFVGVGGNTVGRSADDFFEFPDNFDPLTPEGVRDTQFKTTTMSLIPQPSRTMYSVTEDDREIIGAAERRGFNLHGFTVQISPPVSASGIWIDTPALWNVGRINISYLDGSVDAPNIIYEQLEATFNDDDDGHDVTELGLRPAFRAITSILMPGVIRPEIQ